MSTLKKDAQYILNYNNILHKSSGPEREYLHLYRVINGSRIFYYYYLRLDQDVRSLLSNRPLLQRLVIVLTERPATI